MGKAAAQPDSAMVEPMAMQEPESVIPLQDSLGPELMKMLEDFGGVEGDLIGQDTAAAGTALDSAIYSDVDMYADGSGMTLGLETPGFSAPELGLPSATQCAPSTPQLAPATSVGCAEVSPPASAFIQASQGLCSPNSPTKVHTPQKPRSIRRARSSLPGAMQQQRGSDEKLKQGARIRRATSVTNVADPLKQGSGSSPKSCSTTFVPFSQLNAVETCPEEALMAAKGRRLKRRGSGRSSCDGDEGLLQPQQHQQQQQQAQQQQQPPPAPGGPSVQTEPSTLSGNSVSEAPLSDGAENARMHQLLEAQKRAFEARLEESRKNVSELARQMLSLQMEKQLLEHTLQQVLELQPGQMLSGAMPTTTSTSEESRPTPAAPSTAEAAPKDGQANGQVPPPKKVPVLFNPTGAYDAEAVLLVSLGDTAITLTAQQVTGMPWRQFVRLMKAYVGAIGQLLPEAEAQPKSEAARRAEQLGREAMYIGSCLAAGIPRHTRTLYCLKLQESGPEHSRAPPQLWAQITLAMNLTPAQKQETIRRRRAFLTAMAELMRRRRAIQAGMQATPARPEGSIAGLSTDYLRAADTVERLQQNLDKDHSLVRRFTGGIVHQVWTPLQFARALVQSFPWTPDPLSIANCCAEAAREPSADSYLAAPRQPPPSLFSGLTLSQGTCIPHTLPAAALGPSHRGHHQNGNGSGGLGQHMGMPLAAHNSSNDFSRLLPWNALHGSQAIRAP